MYAREICRHHWCKQTEVTNVYISRYVRQQGRLALGRVVVVNA